MKVGDLVKHKYGTLFGGGLVVEMPPKVGVHAGDEKRLCVMWNCHGNITFHNMAIRYFEVVNESR
jgi:hypothetical protein